MSETFHGWAAKEKGGKLAEIDYDPGAMRPDQVQVKIESCGICHSDLSMIDNSWGSSQYPLVPGHEVIGMFEPNRHTNSRGFDPCSREFLRAQRHMRG